MDAPIRKKVPTARQMAAKILWEGLEVPFGLTTEDLSAKFGTRVNTIKRAKVAACVENYCKKLKERCHRIWDLHVNPIHRPTAFKKKEKGE